MTFPRDIVRENKSLSEWCILHGYRGSIAHGMYITPKDPNSIDDKDTMAICVPTAEHYLGLRQFGSRGTLEIKRNEWDIVVYEARKYISLAAQGNPNVLSLLWLAPQYYILRTPAGDLLIENRHLFVGKHVYKPFIGYARSQLSRMERFEHKGYMGEKRKTLVQKYGYDTKNAAHLIRLLRMGIEFLTGGKLYVERDDASQLLDIKHGLWSLERVKEEADKLFVLAQEAYIRSELPPKPDMDKINELCVRVIQIALSRPKLMEEMIP